MAAETLIHPFSALKLLKHAPRVEAMLRGEVVYPVSVEFDLSNRCPHNCGMCSFGTNESGGYRQQNWVTFPFQRALSLLDELKALGVQSITFTGGGEPLVHPQAALILQRASDLGLEWGLVTNGLLLKGKVAEVCAAHATFVRVSLDAGSAATHMVTHGVDRPQFEDILRNLRGLRQRSATVTIGASFCVQPANAIEVLEAATLVKMHGGNYLEVRPTFPTDWRGDGWSAVLSGEQLDAAKAQMDTARATLQDGTFQVIGLVDRFDALAVPVKAYSACRIGPLTTVIGADGRCWYCCVHRGIEGFSYGNVLDRPFTEVWQGHPSVQAGINLKKCPRCRYDQLNVVIEKAFLQDGMHAAFI